MITSECHSIPWCVYVYFTLSPLPCQLFTFGRIPPNRPDGNKTYLLEAKESVSYDGEILVVPWEFQWKDVDSPNNKNIQQIKYIFCVWIIWALRSSTFSFPLTEQKMASIRGVRNYWCFVLFVIRNFNWIVCV